MFKTAYPRHRAFDTHAETSVRHRPELAQVEVPFKRLARQFVFLNALHQQIVTGHALSTSDDFSITFRREHVYAQRQVGTFRIRLHVKRLDRGGVAMHQQRPVAGAQAVSAVFTALAEKAPV